MSNVFFDTNIIFYAYDSSEPEKQSKAQDLIADSIASGAGFVSVQVLGEFFHATVIRKKVLTSDEAEAILKNLGALNVLDIDFQMVRKAIDIHRVGQTGYWNSLVIAAALRAHCGILYTEDLNNGQDFDGVVAVNPFAN